MRWLTAGSQRYSQASQVLLGPLYRVTMWLRIGLAAHAVLFNALRVTSVAHPGLLVAAMILIAAWTALASIAYSRQGRRTGWFAAADVAVTVLLMVASPYIIGATYGPAYEAIPMFWAAGAPVAVAMGFGTRQGVIAGVIVGVAKLLTGPITDPVLWGGLVGFTGAAAAVGMFVEVLLGSMGERDRALAASAALAERDRLNRIVHDGVLQVLALVEREGTRLGPRGIQLAELAREQETRLRTLLWDRAHRSSSDTERDLTAVLDQHSSASVTISVMADEVPVSATVATEVDAIVNEILTNVAKHGGPGAQAWLLLEQEGHEIIISVRDNGVGTTQERLNEATSSDRVGVRESILGRVRDLGGQAVVRTAPGRGVEWELRIPVE